MHYWASFGSTEREEVPLEIDHDPVKIFDPTLSKSGSQFDLFGWLFTANATSLFHHYAWVTVKLFAN